jgi:murein DD-endopeptidase MepM/ murein hydrolase activator NlpD
MDLEKLLQVGKSMLKNYVKKKIVGAIKAAVFKFLAWASPILIPLIVILILFIVVYGTFFYVPIEYRDKEGTLGFFTSGAKVDKGWSLEQDAELMKQYKDLSENGYNDGDPSLSFGSKEAVPYQLSPFEQASAYRLSWALLGAVDRMIGDPMLADEKKVQRKPDPIHTYELIGPRFYWKDTTVTVTACREEKTKNEDGTYDKQIVCSTSDYKTKLITEVNQYDRLVNITYRWETKVLGSPPNTTTVRREVIDKVTVTPYTFTRLQYLLLDYGVKKSDDRMAIEIAKRYDPDFAAYTEGDDFFTDTGFVSADIPSEYLPIYKEAEAKYGVPWNILAAIHYVETSFGKNLKVSSAGAVGHMQFMPDTWKAYGVDADGDGIADPYNAKDAIFSAANYLSANMKANNGDINKAIWLYNHADWYVEKVLKYAELFGSPVPVNGTIGLPMERGSYTITSPFGNRRDPITGKISFHDGIDLAAPEGTPIFTPMDGVVIFAGELRGYGNAVIIDHGNGFTTLYGHIRDGGIKVDKEEKVKAGQFIAEVGSTGRSTGNHLHFQVKRNGSLIDPETIFHF